MEVLEAPKTRSSSEEMSRRYRLFRTFMLLLGRIFLGFTVHEDFFIVSAFVLAAAGIMATPLIKGK